MASPQTLTIPCLDAELANQLSAVLTEQEIDHHTQGCHVIVPHHGNPMFVFGIADLAAHYSHDADLVAVIAQAVEGAP